MVHTFKYIFTFLCLFVFVVFVYIILTRSGNTHFKSVGEKVNRLFVRVAGGVSINSKSINSINPALEWLNISEGHQYSDYGDNTCGDNPYRYALHPLFERWIELANNNNITYYIFAGTLLGAWRNSDIIPYDSDVDLLVDRIDGPKLEAIKSKRDFSESDNKIHLALQEDWRLPFEQRRRIMCNGKVVPEMDDQCSFQEPFGRLIMGNIHVDIYDYYWENGTMYELSDFVKQNLPKDTFPLKKCMFMGLETVCPSNPKAHLKPFYGNNLHPSKKCKNKDWWSV